MSALCANVFVVGILIFLLNNSALQRQAALTTNATHRSLRLQEFRLADVVAFLFLLTPRLASIRGCRRQPRRSAAARAGRAPQH